MTTFHRISRRALLQLAGGSLAVAALTGCQQLVPPPPPPPTPSPQARPSGPTLVLATSELVVGPNRFAVGIIDPSNQPIADAQVTFGFFQLNGSEGVKRAEAPATFRWVDQKTR